MWVHSNYRESAAAEHETKSDSEIYDLSWEVWEWINPLVSYDSQDKLAYATIKWHGESGHIVDCVYLSLHIRTNIFVLNSAK